jgi:TolB-like protein/tetratricopeptide (TPR) repeat protein
MTGQRVICGPFELDQVAHVVLRRGELLPVGQRGALLLEALFKRPGEVLTKHELMDAAWPTTTVEESNLSVQIAALRKALGPSPDGGDWIVTVPRVGYRFVVTADAPIPPAAMKSERHSIAVLPFESLSTESEQTYFCDGLAEELITMLSQIAGLLVIARKSSFAYRGSDLDVRKVAEDLNVRYVLAGGVRTSGGRIRVTVQLVEGETGGHLWADRYDRELTDVWAIQDDVTRRVVEALQLMLPPALGTSASAGGTKDLEALDLHQRARAMNEGPTKNLAVFEHTCDLLRRAIARDPIYAEAHATLANVMVLDYLNRWTADPDGSLNEARELAERAIKLAPDAVSGHLSAWLAAMLARDFDRSDRELDIAATLNPNHPSIYDGRANQLMRKGDPLAAILYYERAMRLDPLATIHYLHSLGVAYFHLDRFETAAALFRERILIVPETDMSRSYLTSALGHLGRFDEARRVHEELMEVNAKYDLAAHLARIANLAEGYTERIFAGWHKAGLLR